MARERLTDAFVQVLAERPRGSVIWDTELWGFGCRLPAGGGEPVYFVHYRPQRQGRRERHDLGTRRAVTCAQARRMAQEVIGRNAPHQLGRAVAGTARSGAVAG